MIKKGAGTMGYENKAIASVIAKLESTIKDLEALNKEEFAEQIDTICKRIKETMGNLETL